MPVHIGTTYAAVKHYQRHFNTRKFQKDEGITKTISVLK